jgi:hypothetical protein
MFLLCVGVYLQILMGLQPLRQQSAVPLEVPYKKLHHITRSRLVLIIFVVIATVISVDSLQIGVCVGFVRHEENVKSSS